LGRSDWASPRVFGDGWLFDHVSGTGRILISPHHVMESLDRWIHASISWRDHMPSYVELSTLHRAVWPDGWAYQVFAPPAEHVNIHEYALHLFGRVDGAPALPDFAPFGSI
jgi:hypothetical protein